MAKDIFGKINDLYIFSANLPENKVSFCKTKYESLDVGRKVFIDNNIELHPVMYISSEDLDRLKSFKNNRKEYFNELNNAIDLVHPFDIPIYYEKTANYFYGFCSVFEKSALDKKIKFPIFNKIIMSNTTSEFTSGIYNHEIVHTQLISVPNSVKDFSNTELLPMFFEKLTALASDPSGEDLSNWELIRMGKLSGYIKKLSSRDREEAENAYMRIESTLKSEHLFDIYMNADEKDKKIIIGKIQDVFDGKYPVENILKENNVTIENSMDVKVLKKHIKGI